MGRSPGTIELRMTWPLPLILDCGNDTFIAPTVRRVSGVTLWGRPSQRLDSENGVGCDGPLLARVPRVQGRVPFHKATTTKMVGLVAKVGQYSFIDMEVNINRHFNSIGKPSISTRRFTFPRLITAVYNEYT